jgi:hypothetical protein
VPDVPKDEWPLLCFPMCPLLCFPMLRWGVLLPPRFVAVIIILIFVVVFLRLLFAVFCAGAACETNAQTMDFRSLPVVRAGGQVVARVHW